jgi:hypothetical protein
MGFLDGHAKWWRSMAAVNALNQGEIDGIRALGADCPSWPDRYEDWCGSTAGVNFLWDPAPGVNLFD